MTLGEKLAEIRQDKGLRQKDVAEILGVATSTVGSWETNTNDPPTDKLLELSKLYDTNVDYLLQQTDESIRWDKLLGSRKVKNTNYSISKLVREIYSLNEDSFLFLVEILKYLHFKEHRNKK